MTTLSTTLAALLDVAKFNFLANQSDVTYGQLYANMLWFNTWPWDEGLQDTFPRIHIYANAGTVQNQGLGTVKAWRHPRVRVEVFANKFGDAMQAFEQLRVAWIADFNTLNGNGLKGQGYLRQTGGIKYIEIGEHSAADWEKRLLVYRRLADLTLEIGD
jgi:hypothetical protein